MKILLASLLTALIGVFPASTSFYDFQVKTIDGESKTLSAYKGKTILVVNVASKCGFTPQYEDLQTLYETYRDKGFVILGFPANNFGSQEPGSNAQIKAFCTSNFGVDFPMFEKISVKGDDIHPLYNFLTSKSENGVLDAPVKWNFQKFLIGPDGTLKDVFYSRTNPMDEDLTKAIESLL